MSSLPHNPHCTILRKRVQLNFRVSKRGRLDSTTPTELSHHPNMAFLNEKKNSTVNEKLLSSMIPHTVIRSIPEPNFRTNLKNQTSFIQFSS